MAKNSRQREIKGYLKEIVGAPGTYHALYDTNLVGRSLNAEVYVPNTSISRSHCRLSFTSAGIFITDLGGVNGTFVNGEQLKSHRICPLEFGSTIFLGPPVDSPQGYVFVKEKEEKLRDKGAKSNFAVYDCPGTSSVSNDLFLNIHRSEEADKNSVKKLSNGYSNLCFSRSVSKKESEKPPRKSRISLMGTDNGFVSDSSISSLDSLKTRIRKYSSSLSKKKKTRVNCLQSSEDENDQPKSPQRSFSEYPSKKRPKVKILSDSDETSQKTDGINSESLLRDSILCALDDSFPFSPSLENKTDDTKSHVLSISKEERMTKLHNENEFLRLELKKSKEDYQRALSENREQDELIQRMRGKEDSYDQMKEDYSRMMEEELICNICTEIFIKAVALGCSHTFCEFCIMEWKRKKKQCPNCRKRIETETKVLVLDSFIDKMVETMGPDYQDRRKDVMKVREESKVPPKKRKKKACRSRNQRRPRAPQNLMASVNEIAAFNEMASLDEMAVSPSALSFLQNSESSSDEVEILGRYGRNSFYGGYGNCYNCGESGHWANSCPQRAMSFF